MRFDRGCDSVAGVAGPISTSPDVTLRFAGDDDWPAMRRLAATCFGSFRDAETTAVWRSMAARDGVVIACDGADLVGMALPLDLELTVPGGKLLRAAGITWVAVAPTHRRRGVLRAMFVELHNWITRAGYPIAALLASEATIYSRFGYGPATDEISVSVDRRGAEMHSSVPRMGGVRVVDPVTHRDQLADIYERWRRRTPGGLHTPAALWDEVLADRESARRGGSPLFALLHADGFVMYRTHVAETKSVEVTKFTAVTPDAHIALWQTLLGLDLMTSITADIHPGDPLRYLLADPRRMRTVNTEDALWLRIIDIPAVLEARSYLHEVTAVLDVSDDELGGGGRYLLSISDGRARCVPSDAPADVRLDLSILGSIYLGAHRPSVFAAAHRLQCPDPQLLRGLDLAFGSEVPAELGFGF
ncbi:GNAT family N-acetyltransferase [Mycolicibacterium rhodesiae]|uniref:GNAT family N-acetyltransferase n=1 Tax=Mycolicibacterium rhodesiae TaxID=36814 RepID=A0A1X0IXL6_MYCRH|nr:enhanced intracellular survival protein Eis [Mycolicibacterium rhodesiae]ORB53856.1 GNAT family N-acetyltransferase [Mycolicibacterium rhodesiae]